MNDSFIEYYRCPDFFAKFDSLRSLEDKDESGYFIFGDGLICYGKCSVFSRHSLKSSLIDVWDQVRFENNKCLLPFNPSEVAIDLRRERYVCKQKKNRLGSFVRQVYYYLRPILPVSVRRHLQRKWLRGWENKLFPHWPVDYTVDQMFSKMMYLALKSSSTEIIPFIWFWPKGSLSCAVMTHDVETEAGLKFSSQLMDINDSYNIKSSFQLIPDARYKISKDTIQMFRERCFEVNVHDLKHDGLLFENFNNFKNAAQKISKFAANFDIKGFRSGALYRNQEWLSNLKVSYDMSVPNVGHLDPQPGGCCTVMPYFLDDLLEIPVTITQDYSLFNIIGMTTTNLWLEQIELIRQKNGLMSFIIHPDYLNSVQTRKAYISLLASLDQLRATSQLWVALPGEVDIWWRQRSKMKIVSKEGTWHIEGEGSERAQIAYAKIYDEKVSYIL